MASTYIYRNHTAGNRTTWTWSGWIKRGAITGNQSLFTSRTDNANYSTIRLEPDRFHIFDLVSGGFNYQVKTNTRLNDTTGWYHLLVAFDTTQSTASDRIKLYVNGEQITSLAESSYPAQNYQSFVNQADTHYLGQGGNLGDKFDGCMSHVHFVDGTALTPSTFGSTDSTTGEWKINTSPTISSYGTNGFFILKDGNSTTDQSGEGHNWTVSGTLTKTEDCPSNVFATLNPLHPSLNTARVFTNGNTTMELGGTARVPEVSTLGMTSGKFYAEMKDVSGTGGKSIMGITGQMWRASNVDWLGSKIYDYSYYSNVGDKANNASETSYGNSWTNGDIIGVAVDLDNLKIYFSKNGVWQNSGDPTSGSTGTGAAFTIANPSSTVDGAYFFACGDDNAYASRTMSWNFGNGYFGTTAVSSAGTNASGIGIFEYNVPTGYTALSTKGLNE